MWNFIFVSMIRTLLLRIQVCICVYVCYSIWRMQRKRNLFFFHCNMYRSSRINLSLLIHLAELIHMLMSDAILLSYGLPSFCEDVWNYSYLCTPVCKDAIFCFSLTYTMIFFCYYSSAIWLWSAQLWFSFLFLAGIWKAF